LGLGLEQRLQDTVGQSSTGSTGSTGAEQHRQHKLLILLPSFILTPFY
jgi:hypothetical protein